VKSPSVAAQLARISPEALRRELREYGAWDDSQLADHEANLRRWVWIVGGDISEEYRMSGRRNPGHYLVQTSRGGPWRRATLGKYSWFVETPGGVQEYGKQDVYEYKAAADGGRLATRRNPSARYHDAEAAVEQRRLSVATGRDEAHYRTGRMHAHQESSTEALARKWVRRNPALSPEDQAGIAKIKGVEAWMLQDPRFIAALNKYLEFHGCWPTSLSKRDIKGMGNPQDKDFFVNMGKAPDVSYIPGEGQEGSNKHGSAWIHEFNEGGDPKDMKALPDRLCSGDGKTIITHGGNFEVKDWVQK